MKRIFCTVLCIVIAVSCIGCGAKQTSTPAATPAPTPEPTPEPVPVLTGNWEQTNKNSEDSYQIATIADGTIEVFWKTPDMEALYWSGTFTAPTAAGDYSWESVNNKEKTDMALMASCDDTKTFTYSNGVLSYSVTAMGVTTTVKMEKK